jgi:hypothetical protein
MLSTITQHLNTRIFNKEIERFIPSAIHEVGIIYFMIIYLILGLGSRYLANKFFPKVDKNLYHKYSGKEIKQMNKKHETISRWPISLFHATCAFILVVLNKQEIVDINLGLMNMNGYFIIDSIIDHDLEYILHHLAPMVHNELICFMGAKLDNTVNAYFIVEKGNIIAHTAALFTFRSGKVFHYINTASFWISRPISMFFVVKIWTVDINDSLKYTWPGIGCFISILIIYVLNIRWMIKMILPRENTSVDNKESIKKLKKN